MDAIGNLLQQYFRLSSKKRYDYHDPGRPPTDEEIAGVIALLTDVQRRVTNDDLIRQLHNGLNTTWQKTDGWNRPKQKAEKSALVKAVLERDPAVRGAALANWSIVLGLVERSDSIFTYNNLASAVRFWIKDAITAIAARKHTLTLDQVRAILDANRSYEDKSRRKFGYDTLEMALSGIAASREEWSFTDEDRETFADVIEALSNFPYQAKTRTHIAMLRELVQAGPQAILWTAEPWAQAIEDSIATKSEVDRRVWSQVLTYAGTCSMSKPSRSWLEEAERITSMIPAGQWETQLSEWLRRIVAEPRANEPQEPTPYSDAAWDQYRADSGHYLSNTSHAAGLVWLTLGRWCAAFGPLLANVTEAIAKWPQQARQPSANIGAAAVKALGAVDDEAALSLLLRLEMRVRWPKLKKIVKKQLEETIKRRGVDRGEIEEVTVPDFGLRDGVAKLPFGEWTAQLTLGLGDKPSLAWRLADGKATRVIPASVKASHPKAAEQIKQLTEDVEKMRSAQRTRLDLLLRRSKTWTLADWRRRYLVHGLIGTLARRLIWVVGDTPVIWRDGHLVDVSASPQQFDDDAIVRIWHPVSRSVDEVMAWRRALDAWEISQPFKQAHREVYLLTDAERRTKTYSNRFAAHVLRSMTLLPISQVRQWKSGLFGGQSSPSFDLSEQGLRAEWWLQMAGEDHTPFGTPLYLASDQLRFVIADTSVARTQGHTGDVGDPLPLDRVPALVLSEIMRDIDLFVGLASVGNDPNWQDGGPAGRYREYWHSYSFGELNESARTRRAVLETLLPRLTKLKDRWSLDDRFLVIRGSLRTYKIHLGSGNILMKPNDQYLCILPDASARKGGPDGLFLPFEGDSVLSIILSKAFLLADDAAITDVTITRQIGREK